MEDKNINDVFLLWFFLLRLSHFHGSKLLEKVLKVYEEKNNKIQYGYFGNGNGKINLIHDLLSVKLKKSIKYSSPCSVNHLHSFHIIDPTSFAFRNQINYFHYQRNIFRGTQSISEFWNVSIMSSSERSKSDNGGSEEEGIKGKIYWHSLTVNELRLNVFEWFRSFIFSILIIEHQ